MYILLHFIILFIHSIKKENPHPGRPYKGVTRHGYLPNNSQGRQIAKLLNVAFSRRLVFTIGRSQTTEEDGVITWNGIPHKTRIFGGPEKYDKHVVLICK